MGECKVYHINRISVKFALLQIARPIDNMQCLMTLHCVQHTVLSHISRMSCDTISEGTFIVLAT